MDKQLTSIVKPFGNTLECLQRDFTLYRDNLTGQAADFRP